MKKGFTLAEMLGVIIILALLALIVFPTVASLIKKSKDDAYNEQVDYILNAANNWVTANSVSLSLTSTNCLSIKDLTTSGFMDDKTIVDPRDDSVMNGYVKIVYDETYKQFTKTYVTTCP